MKKTLALILALIMIVACFAGCGNTADTPAADAPDAAAPKLAGKDISTENVKMAYIPVSTAGATTEIAQYAADDIMTKYPNVEITFFDAGYDPTQQASIVTQCIAQDYDAIIMECTDDVAMNPLVTEAEKAGVVVITTNMACSAVHSAYLSNYSYDAGWLIGQLMVEDIGTEGKVILLDCPAGMVAGTLHGKGFQDYIAQNSNLELIDYANIDGFSTENANTAMRDMLTKHDEIDAVYGMSDDIAIGAIQAIEAAGRSDEGILVYGSEGMPNAITAIREGTMKATAWSDRYSLLSLAFNIALLHIDAGINGATLGYEETPSVSLPFQPVTSDNVETMVPRIRYAALQD
ncbi:MAG: sugar ABC transporter substrate-binding protein [Oscillospiraceae bacterium]|nr:sugar ABC transporter substrate-binding protein [Oscillospiraceae bacterium]